MSGEHAPQTEAGSTPTTSQSIEASGARDLPNHDASKLGLVAGLQPASLDAPYPSTTVASSPLVAPLSAHGEGPGVRFPGPGVRSLALLLDSDLFFAVKVTDTLKHAGYDTKTLRRAEDFAAALAAEAPALALVHTGARGLDWRAGIAAAVAASVPVVAFGSHVDLAAQQEARDLGATSVIANSKLAADLPGVVARTLSRHHPHQE
ncbi:MAG: hypothetical protein ACRDHP_02260 [Ktedonobacterales bacterium]